MSEAQLSALQRSIGTGNKLILAGAGFSLTTLVMCWTFAFTNKASAVKVPGIEVSLPVPFGIVTFSLLAAGSGIAGLAFLVQALRTMRQIELGTAISMEDLKASLTGVALISASTILFRAICLGTVAAQWAAHRSIAYLFSELYVGTYLGKWGSSAFWNFMLFVDLPYFYLCGCEWIRWFNPECWSGPGLTSRVVLLLDGDGWQELHSVLLASLKNIRTQGSACNIVAGRLERAADEAFMRRYFVKAWSVLLRRYGAFGVKSHQKEGMRYMIECLTVEIGEILQAEFPEIPISARAHFASHALGGCSCVQLEPELSSVVLSENAAKV